MTKDEALKAARLTAEWEGWRWYEPVQVTRKKPLFSRTAQWQVRAGVRDRRCDFEILIDDATGKVTEKHDFRR
ncbi:MAG: hypothetical protein O2894_00205 [Planctomycetota bacterium]|nr:hypothetical protein [Planctomycetota bacterium]